MRTAFRNRANRAVAALAESAGVDALARALESATDFGTIAWALGHVALPGAARSVDPFADALARGAEERARLSASCGGLLSATEAARVLGGISRQAVDKRRRAGQLLAVQIGGDWRYPGVQFGRDGVVPRALAIVLSKALASGMGAWSVLDFLLAPEPALAGRSPADVLHAGPDGREIIRLLDAAQADAFG